MKPETRPKLRQVQDILQYVQDHITPARDSSHLSVKNIIHALECGAKPQFVATSHLMAVIQDAVRHSTLASKPPYRIMYPFQGPMEEPGP